MEINVTEEMGNQIERIQFLDKIKYMGITNIRFIGLLTEDELKTEFDLVKNGTSKMSSAQRKLVVLRYEFEQAAQSS
tara:strand:+ start:321 stop:551 length:231 start_codon:yes stop_codon:yes gene_type:complete